MFTQLCVSRIVSGYMSVGSPASPRVCTCAVCVYRVQISLPYAISLYQYLIVPEYNDLTRGANTFVLAGSSDGSTWILVDSRSVRVCAACALRVTGAVIVHLSQERCDWLDRIRTHVHTVPETSSFLFLPVRTRMCFFSWIVSTLLLQSCRAQDLGLIVTLWRHYTSPRQYNHQMLLAALVFMFIHA